MPKVGTTTPIPPRKPTLEEREKTAAATLAAKYDDLNEQYNSVEAFLRALKPIGFTYVTFDEENNEHGPSRYHMLGMWKHEGKWRLMHGESDDFSDAIDDPKPIIECPVEVRVRAAKHIRKLHEKMVKKKEEYIPAVDEAIAELKTFCGGK